jgi:hypothetical protein
LAILSCPGCSHKLRVPDNKRGKVTCPLCGSEWFHPEAIELSSVEFRCSASGARFNVISSRRSPLHKFTVQKVERAIKAAPSTQVARAPASSSLLKHHDPRLALPPIKGRVGWLARIIGSKTGVATEKAPNEVPTDRPTPLLASATTSDADEYNWSGFSCPYCNAVSFVSCGGGHLACDGTIQVRKDGRFHQCFCGHAAFISGNIKTFDNKRLSVEAQVDAPNAPPADRQRQSRKAADATIPAPAQGLPAKR